MPDFPSHAKHLARHANHGGTFMWHCLCGADWTDDPERKQTYPEHQAATWEQARTVRTVEELEALPVGAVVHISDGPGGIYEKDSRGDWGMGDDTDYLLREAECAGTTVRVIYHPDWDAQEAGNG